MAKDIVIINFFNEGVADDHVFSRIDRYHWNFLSRSKLIGLIESGEEVWNTTIVDYYPFLKWGKLKYLNKRGRPVSRSTRILRRKHDTRPI